MSTVERRHAVINGTKYSYIYSAPSTTLRGALLFIHGFPDTSYGWRHQVAYFNARNYICIAPDMMGYNDTESPDSLEKYTLKTAADDLRALLSVEKIEKAIVVGHDWGGPIAWRMANYHPNVVEKLVVICTPYFAPADEQTPYVPIEELVKRIPSFNYQIYLSGPKSVEEINANKSLFFKALFRKHTDTQVDLTSSTDLMTQLISSTDKEQTLLTDEELKEYLNQFSKHGFRGPTNWYRTRKLNHSDERSANLKKEIDIPTLFIGAQFDPALPPTEFMLAATRKYVSKLEVHLIGASHWVMVEARDEVNEVIDRWLSPKAGL